MPQWAGPEVRGNPPPSLRTLVQVWRSSKRDRDRQDGKITSADMARQMELGARLCPSSRGHSALPDPTTDIVETRGGERRRFWQRELLADHRYAALQLHFTGGTTQCAAAGELRAVDLWAGAGLMSG